MVVASKWTIALLLSPKKKQQNISWFALGIAEHVPCVKRRVTETLKWCYIKSTTTFISNGVQLRYRGDKMETLEIYKDGNKLGLIYNDVYQLKGNKQEIMEHIELIINEVI
jgi:hypothetical protein